MRSVIAGFGIAVMSDVQADAQVNVTQEHNNSFQDGVYVDAAFTPSAATSLTRDLTFDGTISGTDPGSSPTCSENKLARGRCAASIP